MSIQTFTQLALYVLNVALLAAYYFQAPRYVGVPLALASLATVAWSFVLWRRNRAQGS